MPPDPIDLRQILEQVAFAAHSADSAIIERSDTQEEVREINEPIKDLTNEPPAEISGFIDGIQWARVISWINHRPIVLNYTAAGVTLNYELIHFLEHFWLSASELDIPTLSEVLPVSLELTGLPTSDFTSLEDLAFKALDSDRRYVEDQAITTIVSKTDLPLVVDGSISAYLPRLKDKVCGVVKTVNTRYLDSEEILSTLPVGFRSPRFAVGTGKRSRWSCYLRLHSNENASWKFGLIRLEATDLDFLDNLGSLCITHAQSLFSTDPRAPVHLKDIRLVEELLKSRRPNLP